MVYHCVCVGDDVPVSASVAVADFKVMYALCLGVGVCTVVGVVVALWLAVAECVTGVNLMWTFVICESEFGIQEIVCLSDV